MMLRRAAVLLSTVLISGLGLAADPNPDHFCDAANVKRVEQMARGSLRHFIENAWDERLGVFYTTLGGRTAHVLGESRLLYSLVHTSAMGNDHMAKAERLGRFFIDNFIHPTEFYFFEKIDFGKVPTLPVKNLILTNSNLNEAILSGGIDSAHTVNYQAYGLTGLVALYGKTTNQPLKRELEQVITQVYRRFVERFHDEVHLGFFDFDNAEGRTLKSYNSTVYVATSFLFELYRHSTTNRDEYRDRLIELADLVAAHFLDPKTGWIIENFDRAWKPKWRNWQLQSEGGEQQTIGIVGHNFQAAWMLVRASNIEGVSEGRRSEYRRAAASIINAMLNKRVVDPVHGGVYNAYVRETDRLKWGTDKAWWQQSEAILALSDALKANLIPHRAEELRRHLQSIIAFYLKFDDPVGGVWQELREDGSPKTESPKISDFTGVYHEVETWLHLRR